MIKKKNVDTLNWYTKYYKAHYERKNKLRDDVLNPETVKIMDICREHDIS